MISLITYIPGIIAAFFSYIWSPERVFIYIYLPVLLLLPQTFNTEVAGLPHVSFAEAAIIPIAFMAILNRAQHWKFGITDVLIVAYIASFYVSEIINYNDQNPEDLKVAPYVKILFPYMLGKLLIYPSNQAMNFAKSFVACMCVNIVLSLYEVRFAVNPYFIYLAPYFSAAQAASWHTLFRWGLVRFAGPLVHSILMGIGICVALLFQYWIWKNEGWSRYFKKVPIPFLPKNVGVTCCLVLGLFLTLSRGPIMGLLVGLAFLGLGTTKKMLRSGLISLALLTAIGYYAYDSIQYYSQVTLGSAVSEQDENAAYRIVMIDQYLEIGMEKPIWGWGRSLPTVRTMKSVDNQYLFFFTKYGFVGLTLYVMLFAFTISRLFIKGLTFNVVTQRQERSLAFTLISIFLTLAASMVTVFMGVQIETIFFILLGLADAVVVMKPPEKALALVR